MTKIWAGNERESLHLTARCTYKFPWEIRLTFEKVISFKTDTQCRKPSAETIVMHAKFTQTSTALQEKAAVTKWNKIKQSRIDLTHLLQQPKVNQSIWVFLKSDFPDGHSRNFGKVIFYMTCIYFNQLGKWALKLLELTQRQLCNPLMSVIISGVSQTIESKHKHTVTA